MRGLWGVVAACATACSAFMRDVPPSWDPSQGEPGCSASETAPALDLAVAVPLYVIAAVYGGLGLGTPDEHCGDPRFGPDDSCTRAVVFLLAAVPPTWASARGAGIARRCREAREDARAWSERRSIVTAADRLFMARRERALRRRVRRWGSLECARMVDEWLTEPDPAHREILYDRISPDCRKRIR